MELWRWVELYSNELFFINGDKPIASKKTQIEGGREKERERVTAKYYYTESLEAWIYTNVLC